MFLQQSLDIGPLLIRDLRNRQVLVRRQPEGSVMEFRDGSKPVHQGPAGQVGKASILDEERQVVEAIVAGLPADGVAVRDEVVRTCSTQIEAQPTLDITLDPVQTPVVDGVFESRMGSVLAVAVVPLHPHDRIADRQNVTRLYEADDIGQAWIRGGRLIRAPQTAADGNVETLQARLVSDSDEAEILGID